MFITLCITPIRHQGTQIHLGLELWPNSMAHDPNLFYPKPQSEPTHTAGPSFVTWSLLGKPFPSNKERITSKYTILCMPGSTQGTPLLGMPTRVGTKFRGHFHHIPLSPNHPLTTDDIGPSIALTMTVIMISTNLEL